MAGGRWELVEKMAILELLVESDRMVDILERLDMESMVDKLMILAVWSVAPLDHLVVFLVDKLV